MKERLTPAEAADLLSRSVDTLKKWRAKGRYPALSNTIEKGGCVIMQGRSVFYSRSRVEAFASQSQAVS